MWAYVKIAIGASLILTTIAGAIGAMKGDLEEAGMRIAEGGVDVPGFIEKREQVTMGLKAGKIGGLGRYYTMTYRFTTLDGRTLGGEINISKEQAYSTKDGQEITVRYYENQPSINAPLGFKEYMTKEDAQDLPWGTIIFANILFFCGGLWLIWSGWRKIGGGVSMPSMGGGRGRAVSQSRIDSVASGNSGGFGRR